MLDEVLFEGFVTNLGKYNEGELIGRWVEFPIDEDDFDDILESIGVCEHTHYEEFFISDYSTEFDFSPFDVFGMYSSILTINEFCENISDVCCRYFDGNYNMLFQTMNNLSIDEEDIKNYEFVVIGGVEDASNLGLFLLQNYYYDVYDENNRLFDFIDLKELGEDFENNQVCGCFVEDGFVYYI